MKAYQVVVPAGIETPLESQNSVRIATTLRNIGPNDSYIGGPGVTSATGFVVKSTDVPLTISGSEPPHCYSALGTTMHVIEMDD